MTKLGFVMRGTVENRTPAKRRKTRVSLAKIVARKLVVDMDSIAVRSKTGTQSTAHVMSVSKQKSHQRINKISATQSGELSFRMLNSLEDRMKEEEFDAFE
ncbi:hypothetical protein [Citrobacter freundii]|uniref:hypothetical protein n=1 Tax=Citrobacter freundii TaxID=546 RepID=UPI001C7D45F2|nr:hypothetical protein [Citrobacter freundii]